MFVNKVVGSDANLQLASPTDATVVQLGSWRVGSKNGEGGWPRWSLCVCSTFSLHPFPGVLVFYKYDGAANPQMSVDASGTVTTLVSTINGPSAAALCHTAAVTNQVLRFGNWLFGARDANNL